MPKPSNEILNKVNTIRDVFTYTEKFKGSLFLLKIEDDTLDHPNFPLLMQDIVQLQSVGVKIVLILGTRNIIDKTLAKHHIQSEIIQGVRVTTEESLPLIQLASLEISQRVLSLITANGAKGILGNWVKARAVGVLDGVDYQRTGTATHIRTAEINELLSDQFIPIILPLVGMRLVETTM